ncbi:Acyl transferase/acyl hydrolase/lysophospholipase [Vigna unguiculata]|uniref:Acyl transferase/acyl hydrolase/lysophospholipase n=1 Tax=Vigna unguiculata TaxID=3917 RepID=A0A4D6MHX2_VIGUN|nr:Acyl transferase/acyl hydrolase/lysophospholipase [Vigna unguiculata]
MGKEAQNVPVAALLFNKANDILGYADYKPSTLFLFPGQGAQAVGMGKEAQNVPVAALLFSKANDILGYSQFDLLDICINGPKEKVDLTVISQVLFLLLGKNIWTAIS